MERLLKDCIRHPYLEATANVLDDTSGMLAANRERRALREAGRNPEQEN
jgi:hypothetical protein